MAPCINKPQYKNSVQLLVSNSQPQRIGLKYPSYRGLGEAQASLDALKAKILYLCQELNPPPISSLAEPAASVPY